MTTAEVAAAIRGKRFSYSTEDDLQAAISEVMTKAGIEHVRELAIAGGRVDLCVQGRVGVEVKIAGSPAEVQRQIGRYLAGDDLDGLVLVTSRVRHLGLPDEIHGKPVEVVTLAWAGL